MQCCQRGKKTGDTHVMNAAEGEAGAGEPGKTISVQPGFQGNILKSKQTSTDFTLQQNFNFLQNS